MPSFKISRSLRLNVLQSGFATLPVDRAMTCFHGAAAYGDPRAWRKPQPGVFVQAAEVLKIDLAKSLMIGDRWPEVDRGIL